MAVGWHGWHGWPTFFVDGAFLLDVVGFPQEVFLMDVVGFPQDVVGFPQEAFLQEGRSTAETHRSTVGGG